MKKPLSADDIPRDLWAEVIRLGLRRLSELAGQGFATFLAYDVGFLRRHAHQRRTFILQSTISRDKYGIAIDRNATITETCCHALLVAINGEPIENEHWRTLSLVRGERGQIVVKPGWQ